MQAPVGEWTSGWLTGEVFGRYQAFVEGLICTGRLATELTEDIYKGRSRVLKNQVRARQVVVEEIGRRIVLFGTYLDLFHTALSFHGDMAVSEEDYDMHERNGGGEEHRALLALANGTCVTVREIRPGDAPALQRLVDRSSERTIRLRYFGPMKQLSEDQARYFAEVDGKYRYALVALDPEDEGEIVAVVRYDREKDTDRAEYAALVEDRFQGQGLGDSLTRALIQAARERGVRDFEALVLPENKGMIRLLRNLDLPENTRLQDGIKHFSIDLFPEEAAVASGGR